jgi:hypothetical protein
VKRIEVGAVETDPAISSLGYELLGHQWPELNERERKLEKIKWRAHVFNGSMRVLSAGVILRGLTSIPTNRVLDRRMGHIAPFTAGTAESESPRVVRVRDVLVIPSPGHQAHPDEWLEYRAVDNKVDLGHGVFIERIDEVLADQMMTAAGARHLNFEPVRQFGQLYSFWREVPLDEYEVDPYGWDPEQSLGAAVALSRFVLDNAHSFEFAGRVSDRDDEYRQITCTLRYEMRTAYRTRNARFWLTEAEAHELRHLLDQYREVEDGLPPRVRRAMWHADRSSYCPYLAESVGHIVTGLEALLNAGTDEPITSQFVKRSPQLANELGYETSKSYWNWVYEARSRAVHGAGDRLVVPAGWAETAGDTPKDVARVATAQDVLRSAIRRAIEDEQFRTIFETDEGIRVRWPLSTA